MEAATLITLGDYRLQFWFRKAQRIPPDITELNSQRVMNYKELLDNEDITLE